MDRYSLLKRNPAPLLSARPRSFSPPKNSLYKLLESIPDGRVKGIKITAVDGERKREYVVEKYERYKAGLMGRVWLKRTGDISEGQEAKLIADTEALGLKWQL